MIKIIHQISILKNILKPHLLIALITFLTTLPVDSKVFFLEADFYQDKTQDRKIILGKGEIITSDKVISRVAVSDPNIADIQILGEKQLFVRAKQLGISTFLIWEKDMSSPHRFDVAIWPDIKYLEKQLHELDENISVDYIPPTTNLSSSAPSSAESAGEGAAPAGGAASLDPSAGAGTASAITQGKIILQGGVKNAEIIARALQIAGIYVGDQGIKIISQPGGQVVDGLSGRYDIYSNADSQSAASGQNSATSFGARDPIRFTSNRYANLSRGVIATTQMGSVLSFLTVKDPPQIAVAIRFYEVSRNVAKNIGFNTTLGGSTLQGGTFVGGSGISRATASIGSIANLSEFMAGQDGAASEFTFAHQAIAGGSFIAHEIGQGVTGVIFNPDNGISAFIQALQERGEIKTLAEPTLIIANGEPASFLAGGEVPILRSVFTAGGASTDVTYEPFGIKFNMLPTVTGEKRIYLQLIPEIRDIDTELSNFIVPPGSTNVRPPAFKTRRTQTQVELDSGQAFAISGLLREDNTRSLRKVPGVADIPILGSLFRSKSFRKGESELLIVVTPEIVKPTSQDKIAKLSLKEFPYNYFDQMPPLRSHKKLNLDNESGPDFQKPLDAGKYYLPDKETPEEKVQNTVPLPGEKTAEYPILSNTAKILEATNHQPPAISHQPPATSHKPPATSQQVPISKRFKNFILNKRVKKLKNIASISEEEELIKKQELLKEQLEQEAQKYAKAKEAMKMARINKPYN